MGVLGEILGHIHTNLGWSFCLLFRFLAGADASDVRSLHAPFGGADDTSRYLCVLM